MNHHEKHYLIKQSFYGAANKEGTKARSYEAGQIVSLPVELGKVFLTCDFATEHLSEQKPHIEPQPAKDNPGVQYLQPAAEDILELDEDLCGVPADDDSEEKAGDETAESSEEKADDDQGEGEQENAANAEPAEQEGSSEKPKASDKKVGKRKSKAAVFESQQA